MPEPPQGAAHDLSYSDQQRAAFEAAHDRFTKYKILRDEHLQRKIEQTREQSRLNVEQARVLRHRYDRPDSR